MHTNPNFPIGLNSINQALIEMQQQQKQFHDENIQRMKQIHKKMDDAFDKLINSLLEDPDSVENNDIQVDEVESEIAIEADAVKEYEEFHTIALAAPHPQLKLQTEVTCVNPVSVDYSQVLFLSKGETEVCIGEPNSESSVYGMNSLKSWCSLGVRLNVAVGFSSNTADPDSEIGRQNHYSGFKNVEVIRLELSNQCVSPWITCDDEYVDVWLLPGNGLNLSIRLCMLGVCKNVPMKFYYFDANFLSLMEHQNGWSKSGAPLRLTWLAKPPPRPPDVYINIATSRATNGAMTLEQMNVSNHIAKLIVWLSWIQDSEIGNETTEINEELLNPKSTSSCNRRLLPLPLPISAHSSKPLLILFFYSFPVHIPVPFIFLCLIKSLLKLQGSHVFRMIEEELKVLLTWKVLSRNPRLSICKLSSQSDTNEHCSTFKGTSARAALVFIIGFWMLDLVNNTVQGPARALLVDLSGLDQRNSANAIFCSWMAVGKVLGFSAGSTGEWHRWFPFLTSRACCEACGNLKAAFLIAAGFLTFCTLVTVYFPRELPLIENQPHRLSDSAPLLNDPHQVGSDNSSTNHHPEGEDQSDVYHDGPGAVLVNLLTTVRHLPPAVHSVLVVMALSWLSWFRFFLSVTDWMGREVYHGDPSGNAVEVKAYDHGVREGAFGLLLISVVLGIRSFFIEPMCRQLGARLVWAMSNFTVFICMTGTAIISMISVREYSEGIQDVIDGSGSIRIASLVVFASSGFLLLLPTVSHFLAEWTADSGGGQGLAIGY